MNPKSVPQRDRSASSQQAEPDGCFLWRPYCQMKTAQAPFEVVSAEGTELVLADGRRLVDGIANWWTACHGHRHPHLVQALHHQLDVLPHSMLGGMVHPQAQRLARRLAACAPGDLNHVFLVDSGSVAVEVAMKMAVQYWMNRGGRGRDRFVSFVDSYHGDTSGAMSVCDPDDSMHRHFKGFLLEQYPRAIPKTAEDAETLERFVAEHRDHLAGMIIEPLVQAAGGLRFHSPAQLEAIARVAQSQGLLLIFDEIATGFGRTGRTFASEWTSVVPDILCLGKGLSGGMISLAATLARRHVFDAFWGDSPELALMHGPTYMGNPLACAAANASLDLFESEPRLEQVATIEKICRESLLPLQSRQSVVDVRVLGAFAAVQMSAPLDQSRWMAFFVERGLWLRPTRDVFYLAPPFTIDAESLRRLCAGIEAAVDELDQSGSR